MKLKGRYIEGKTLTDVVDVLGRIVWSSAARRLRRRLVKLSGAVSAGPGGKAKAPIKKVAAKKPAAKKEKPAMHADASPRRISEKEVNSFVLTIRREGVKKGDGVSHVTLLSLQNIVCSRCWAQMRKKFLVEDPSKRGPKRRFLRGQDVLRATVDTACHQKVDRRIRNGISMTRHLQRKIDVKA